MTRETNKICAEIIALAIGIDEHDVFVSYSPHVEAIQVKTYDGAWCGDKKPVEDLCIYINDELFADAMMDQLKETKAKLENLLTK